MGGSDKQKQANAQTQRSNIANQRQMDKDNLANEGKARGFEYTSGLTNATREARMNAEGAVTSERARGIKDSSKVMTDFNSQERRRLFEAKKGQGQVSAEDTSITGDMMKRAKSLLGMGSDYWDAKRTSAGDKAFGVAGDAYTKKNGSESDFVKQGALYKDDLLNKKGSPGGSKYKRFDNYKSY